MPHHATGSDSRRRISNADSVIEQRRGSKITSFEQSLLDFAARPLLQDVDLCESYDEKSAHRTHYGSGSSGSSSVSSSGPNTPDSVDAVHGRRFSLEASRQSPTGLSKRIVFMALLSLTSALAVAALVAVGLAGRFRSSGSSQTSRPLSASGSAGRNTLPATILASDIVTPHKHVHLLIPLTPNFHNAESCKTIMAAIVHGYEPIIVNWALTGDDYRGNQFAKISGTNNFLRNNMTKEQENDLVLMIDGSDVWLQQSPDILAHRYHQLQPNAERVIVGSDWQCWPQDPESAECKEVPMNPLPPTAKDPDFWWSDNARWVNSGTVVGTVSEQRRVFARLEEMLETTKVTADQAYFNTLNHEGALLVDYTYRLFMPTTSPTKPVPIKLAHPLEGVNDTAIPYELHPTLLAASQTGEIPVLTHYSRADKKADREELWGKPWWSSKIPEFRAIAKKRLAKGKIRFAHDGDLIASFDKFCPARIFDLDNL